jgi:hypothetical protein
MANCSVRDNCYFNAAIELLAAWDVTYSWLRSRIPFSNRLNFQKMVGDFVHCTYLYEFTVFENVS